MAVSFAVSDLAMKLHRSPARRIAAASALIAICLSLGGCAVAAVVGVAATAVGVAADAAVGAVKLTGAVVGGAVDLVIPDGDGKKE